MNKLIIIGNGFDLAHGLPTSYKHFIDKFWENLRLNYKEDHIKELVYVNENNFNYLDESINNFSNILSSLQEYSDKNNYKFDNGNYTCKSYSSTGNIIFEFRNNFFKKINKKSIINWVDIENEYYQELKIKSKIKKADSIENDNNKEHSNSIKILNDEFEQIRSLFENYLMEHVTKKFYFDKDPSKANSLLNFIKEEPKRYSESNSHKSCLDEFPKEDELELKEFDNKFYEAYNHREVKKFIEDNKCHNIFLNFNYTHSIDQYCNIIKSSCSIRDENYFPTKMIQIHGRLNDRNNQMNFGFGDEMDTD
ncbi:AbiH family protein [Cellulophaga baltica]|uniref:Bacteriophage abortive infection AbiH n=3 Tax=Cellulophaga baltica TaxID=76594 RepID=A0A1G7DLP1_9FLAO|nr:AbiH family protein [Cellulophaga baltica]SDE52418.1 Bacteriophage abortive infection AbiH [Cellulophaga baltica]